MQKYFTVAKFQIPIEFKDLYEEVSNEFENRVYDSKHSKDQNESSELFVKKETRKAMMAMLNKF